MKKIYMIPTIQVVKIQPARILAGSDLDTKTGNATEWGTRRGRFSRYDDEDDEFFE